MDSNQILQSFQKVTERYIQEIERLEWEQMLRKPSEDEWSLGQMYMHLINSALYMQLKNAEACLDHSTAAAPAEEKTERGRAVFAQGSFPPIAIRVPPSDQYIPPQPAGKDQIIDGLMQVVSRMQDIEPQLKGVSLAYTRPHPGFGGLNAKEWFWLVEMHYRHHLHQQERLKAWLRTG
ncbi:DinB superfamily [Chlamydia abortus]|uniref:DinB family protein n=1 Tax=Paenibacillus residui TaxID=629724 RepID=A0ABW3DC29_9BACL|nr:DinB family protein [Paenibacillus sp. 32O-W]SHE11993.1 DinB superfamily [Chlamydia abortus]SHE13939.1 DinB superfamily [Chlamydia abortus]